MNSTCKIPTEHASRYLQQLSKHWVPKFTVTFDPQHAEIVTKEGRTLTMQASPTALDVAVSAPDADDLANWQQVVANHLTRFGFRETLVFDWQPATA